MKKTKFTYAIVGATVICSLILLSGIDTNHAMAVDTYVQAPEPTLIPDYLLPRDASVWVPHQFENVTALERDMESIRAYINADLEPNGWNQAMQYNYLKIINFDTIIGKGGSSYEAAVLVVAKERLLGTETVTNEAVQKYRDWLIQEYPHPETITAIDAEMKELAGHVPNYTGVLEEVTIHLDDMAAHGSPPLELKRSDLDYWGMVFRTAMCEYSNNCSAVTLTSEPNQSGGLGSDSGIVPNSYQPAWLTLSVSIVGIRDNWVYPCPNTHLWAYTECLNSRHM